MFGIEYLQGKMIEVESIQIATIHQELMLSMGVLVEGEKCCVVCQNVSALCLNHFSYPMQIGGFEVVDNLSKGWQSEVRYTVCDYEDGAIQFSCEEISIENSWAR